MVVQVVVLSANGESRQSRITTGEVTSATVTKLCRKTKPAVEIGTAVFGELTLTIWGWKEGKAGTENKHEMPAAFEVGEGELFGDAVIGATSTEDGAAINFTIAQWEKFCSEEGADTDESDEEEGVADGEDLSLDGEDDLVEEDGEEVEADAEAEVEEAEEGSEDGEAEEEEEEAGEDDDCYDDGDEGGGSGKRRAPRRKTTTAPEYRRLDMGLRSRVKVPMPVGKRAPRWQTAPELEEEAYD
jgi:hypothetical protein